MIVSQIHHLHSYLPLNDSSNQALPLLDPTLCVSILQLLQYRRGELDPAEKLDQLDPALRDLILHMIQIGPGKIRGAQDADVLNDIFHDL